MPRTGLAKEELRKIADVIKNAMDQKDVNAKTICGQSNVRESDFSKLMNRQSAIATERISRILDVLSITEIDLESYGLREDTIREIFGPKTRAIISGVLTKVEGAWIYNTLIGEIVFAQGSPRTIIEQKILEDLSNRLKLFLDNNI
jgi:hypothetical protein